MCNDFLAREASFSRTALSRCLSELEAALRHCECWSTQRPTVEALASEAPFCVDTLDFCQWLQYVLIERLRTLLDSGDRMPALSGIAPMAEQVLILPAEGKERLLAVLVALDTVLVSGRQLQ